MKTERIVLSFIAVVIGLLVAGVAFFIYQSTRIIPNAKIPKISVTHPSPTPANATTLSIDKPEDQSVVSEKNITVSGKTQNNATLIVTASGSDQVVSPTSNGSYSVSVLLDGGENLITVTAISPNGDEIKKTITVTYSTEEF